MLRALAFLTPLGKPAGPSPRTLRWFPAVGAGLGLVLGGVWWAAAQIWPPAVAAAVVVAADLGLTGLLHFDGLVDSADGLLPVLDRRRRLAAMADPHAGAFGVGVAGTVILLRWASLAVLAASPLLLAGLWCASRTAMCAITAWVPYARAEGLASAFLGASAGLAAAVAGGAAAGATLAVFGNGWGGLAAFGAVAAGAAGVVALARRRIGGFTGDVLGAAGVIGETAGLLTAAARW